MAIVKTLRHRYPITCHVCKKIILPSQRDEDGELLAEEEPYRMTGIVAEPRTDPADEMNIPVGAYAHTYCLGVERRMARPAPSVRMVSTCEYCGDVIHSGNACASCRQRIERESVVNSDRTALQELFHNLAEMRAELAAPPKASAPQNHESAERTEARRLSRSYAQNAAGLLENPERLGVYEPTNEMGVVFMFGHVIGDLKYKMAYMDGNYPDCVVHSPTGKLMRVELEFRSSSFIAHRHDPAGCDLVVCWLKDRDLSVPVLALHDYFNRETGGFDFAPIEHDTGQA